LSARESRSESRNKVTIHEEYESPHRVLTASCSGSKNAFKTLLPFRDRRSQLRARSMIAAQFFTAISIAAWCG